MMSPPTAIRIRLVEATHRAIYWHRLPEKTRWKSTVSTISSRTTLDFVYNVADRMMGKPEDAEDVSQDAFISAYRAYERFGGESKVTTWLCRFTVNAALMKLRKEKKARTLTRTGLDDVVIADWSDAPERFATNSELGARIKEGIAMLPEDLQTTVVLPDVEG